MPASASPIAARASVKSTTALLVIERLHSERTIGELSELSHTRLGFRECPRRVAETGDSLFEQSKGGAEVQLLAFQLGDDLLETSELLLDRHAASPGIGRTARVVASTSPSRSRRVNAVF